MMAVSASKTAVWKIAMTRFAGGVPSLASTTIAPAVTFHSAIESARAMVAAHSNGLRRGDPPCRPDAGIDGTSSTEGPRSPGPRAGRLPLPSRTRR